MAQRQPYRNLGAICSLPGEAWLAPAEAAIYLNTTPTALAIRRSNGNGPIFGQHGSFIRYQKRMLDDWMMAQTPMRRAARQNTPPPPKSAIAAELPSAA